MKPRPKQHNKSIDDFINSASTEQENASDNLKKISDVQRVNIKVYSLEEFDIQLKEGSSLRKALNIAIKESEWNTIDAHVKKMGISKAQWITYACFKLMKEELKNTDD